MSDSDKFKYILSSNDYDIMKICVIDKSLFSKGIFWWRPCSIKRLLLLICSLTKLDNDIMKICVIDISEMCSERNKLLKSNAK
jgi:hypothetical protein